MSAEGPPARPSVAEASSATPAYAIRVGRIDDVPTIVEFNRRLAWETERKTLDLPTLSAGVAALFDDPSRGRYFVAEASGEVVGQLMITFEWSDWRNGVVWWIQSVYVAAEHRRRGVLRRLFQHVEAESVRDPAVRGLRLYVERENRSAQEAYARLGLDDAGYLVMGRWSAAARGQ